MAYRHCGMTARLIGHFNVNLQRLRPRFNRGYCCACVLLPRLCGPTDERARLDVERRYQVGRPLR